MLLPKFFILMFEFSKSVHSFSRKLVKYFILIWEYENKTDKNITFYFNNCSKCCLLVAKQSYRRCSNSWRIFSNKCCWISWQLSIMRWRVHLNFWVAGWMQWTSDGLIEKEWWRQIRNLAVKHFIFIRQYS